MFLVIYLVSYIFIYIIKYIFMYLVLWLSVTFFAFFCFLLVISPFKEACKHTADMLTSVPKSKKSCVI